MLYFNKNIKTIVRQPQNSYLKIFDPKINYEYSQGINETGLSILELLAKENNPNSIIEKLSNKYHEDKYSVEQKVNKFIILLKKTCFLNENVRYFPQVIGTTKYFTPDYITLELTKKCLLNCSHCYLDKTEKIEISEKKIHKILDDLISIKVSTIQLTGGEPMLYPQIEYVIDTLVNNGIKVLITTSGFYPPEKEDYILGLISKIQKNHGFVQVSLDGLKDTHNSIRKNRSCFERTINVIQKLVKMNIEVHTAMCVQKINFSEVEAVTALVQTLGVKLHRISNIIEEGNATKEILVNTEELIKVINHVSQQYSTKKFVVSNSEYSSKIISNRKSPNCGCGTLMLTISSNLDVYPCTLNRTSMFNLNKIKLIEGLTKYGKKFYNIKAPSRDDCNNCRYLHECLGCLTQGILHSKMKECVWQK